ncbi:hypothetical protein ACFSGI_08810 [Paenibacillus nicotianae]|uniref:YlzJ-like protein n=1 Tax=Paenibacillus nicotianae TaxID=1526551 RepID=A0ABW4UTU4_9BACL
MDAEYRVTFSPQLPDGSFLTTRMERTGSIIKALRIGNEQDLANIIERLYTGDMVCIVPVKITYELEQTE